MIHTRVVPRGVPSRPSPSPSYAPLLRVWGVCALTALFGILRVYFVSPCVLFMCVSALSYLCTPPMPPVTKTLIPAMAAAVMVPATVVAPTKPKARAT